GVVRGRLGPLGLRCVLTPDGLPAVRGEGLTGSGAPDQPGQARAGQADQQVGTDPAGRCPGHDLAPAWPASVLTWAARLATVCWRATTRSAVSRSTSPITLWASSGIAVPFAVLSLIRCCAKANAASASPAMVPPLSWLISVAFPPGSGVASSHW